MGSFQYKLQHILSDRKFIMIICQNNDPGSKKENEEWSSHLNYPSSKVTHLWLYVQLKVQLNLLTLRSKVTNSWLNTGTPQLSFKLKLTSYSTFYSFVLCACRFRSDTVMAVPTGAPVRPKSCRGYHLGGNKRRIQNLRPGWMCKKMGWTEIEAKHELR